MKEKDDEFPNIFSHDNVFILTAENTVTNEEDENNSS
jgi:hypothetical protein